MASTRFFLMLTSLLALTSVLVLYIIGSKTEAKASKMLEIFSRREAVGLHSMEFTATPRQRLTNSKSYRERHDNACSTQ